MDMSEMVAAASLLAVDTGWTCHGAIRTVGGAVELRFKHERGDCAEAHIAPGTQDEAILRSIDETLLRELPFPDWKRGDPAPSFELSMPEPDPTAETLPHVYSLDVGMVMTVVMVDAANGVVRLVPQCGPWEEP